MSISFGQRIAYLVIKLVISVLWAVDCFAYWVNYKKRRALVVNFAYGFLLFLALNSFFINSLAVPAVSKTSDLLSSQIAYEIYGGPIFSSTENKVLGTTAVKLKKPVLSSKAAFPFVSAKAHIIVDKPTGTILSDHNVNRTFAPASTSKLMTALVALDIYKPDEVLIVPEECTQIESTKAWLSSGQSYKAQDLIASLLIGSAGDSGCVLANGKVSQEEFVELMNAKAQKFKMENSSFTNPIGLDGENGSHYSSAWDLYILAGRAMNSERIRDEVQVKEYSFSSQEGEQLYVTNTNKLLWEIPNSVGVKTGTTEGAGEVLVYEYNDGGDINLLMVVLGSEDRFDDTKRMLEWVLSSYTWK